MTDDTKFRANIMLSCVFFLSMALVIFTPVLLMGHFSCAFEWSESNMDYRYSIFKGCMVESPEHGWIREKYFRTYGE